MAQPEIWIVDFEYHLNGNESNNVYPICLVAYEIRSKRWVKQWHTDFGPVPPYPTGKDALLVSYNASAEVDCHCALGWPMPECILDLFTEFKHLINDGVRKIGAGTGLLDALRYFGAPAIDADQKGEMRDLILSGGPWSADQRENILGYCQSDVTATARLLPHILLNLRSGSLFRGRYAASVSKMRHNGIPINTELLGKIKEQREEVRLQLIERVDPKYGVFLNGEFNFRMFEAYLAKNGIPWAYTETGRLNLDKDFLKKMAEAYPKLEDLRQLLKTLTHLRNMRISVGEDGHSRSWLNPFGAKTGRNQPPGSRFIFLSSKWLRGLIEPKPGYAICYLDYSQQEVGIGAALSGDDNLAAAYLSGDCYLAFAKCIPLIPQDATKETHPKERKLCKALVLGTNYLQGTKSLAEKIKRDEVYAESLLREHKRIYHIYWAWLYRRMNHAMRYNYIESVFGWRMTIANGINIRTIGNFPMQANGGEILRLAICDAIDAGIHVAAPIHDAVLIYAPIDRIEQEVAAMRQIMEDASAKVLGGFRLRVDGAPTYYPDHHRDLSEPDHEQMFQFILSQLV